MVILIPATNRMQVEDELWRLNSLTRKDRALNLLELDLDVSRLTVIDKLQQLAGL